MPSNALLDAMKKGAQRRAEKVETPESSNAASDRPGRDGKSNVTGYFSKEVKIQLRVIAGEQDKTIQELLAEGLNYVFAKYGRAEIAEGK